MKKILIALVLVAVLVFVFRPRGEVEIANPASKYCVDQGGRLEIREGPAGQYGICILPDGTECNEWEYFRGECP